MAVNAVRGFQGLVLGRDAAATLTGIPRCKRATTRAEVYASAEMTPPSARPRVTCVTPGRLQRIVSLLDLLNTPATLPPSAAPQ